MTIASTTNRNDYTGNAATSVFAYSFRIIKNTHLKVTVRDIATPPLETTLTLTTDYTVSGVGASSGGNLTLVNASQSWLVAGTPNLKANFKLTIRRVVSLIQETDIRNQGDFFPEVHEDQFDLDMMAAQQQQDELGRSLRLPETESGSSAATTIPVSTERASKFLAFNASGNPIASVGSGTPASVPWASVIDDATIAAGIKTIRDALTDEPAPAIDDDLIVHDLSATTGKRMTPANLLKVINLLTAETVPAADDQLALYDTSGAATDKISLLDLLKLINVLTAETAPAIDDQLVVYDTSDARADKMSLSDLLKVLNGLAEDTIPDPNSDFMLSYDASAAAAKKVSLNLIGPKINSIINGNFDIWQRGTSFAAPTNNNYAADRWRTTTFGGTGVFTVLRSATKPDGLSEFSLQVDVTTSEIAIPATAVYGIDQPIEGFNIQKYGFGSANAKSLTLSFWVRSAKTGIHCVSFLNGAVNRTHIKEYTVAVADTWEYKTIALTADVAGTWLKDSGSGLTVFFSLAAGVNFQSAPNVWAAGARASANQVNVMDNVLNNFHLARVQLEIGSVASEFERRLFGQELALCQRYYTKTFPIGTTPAQNAGRIGALFIVAASTGNFAFDWPYPVLMRATPTVITYNPQAANAEAANLVDTTNTGLTLSSENDSRHFSAGDSALDSTDANDDMAVHVTADAEL